jgi:hypothetical protein
MVEAMLAGEVFIYQTIGKRVYHVATTITEIWSWVSKDPIVAFLDADDASRPPVQFFQQQSVQIIAASLPEGATQKWLKQGDSTAFVAPLAAKLWSRKELFLTRCVIPLCLSKAVLMYV